MKESLNTMESKDIKVMTITDEEIDEILSRWCLEQRSAVKNKKKTPEWTDYLKELRRVAILRLIHQGKSNARICHELHDRWGVGMVSAAKYIDDCLKNISELDPEEPRIRKKKIEEMLEETLERCKAEGKYKEAMQALDMLNKMGGNYVTKVEADIKTEIVFDFGGGDNEDNQG